MEPVKHRHCVSWQRRQSPAGTERRIATKSRLDESQAEGQTAADRALGRGLRTAWGLHRAAVEMNGSRVCRRGRGWSDRMKGGMPRDGSNSGGAERDGSESYTSRSPVFCSTGRGNKAPRGECRSGARGMRLGPARCAAALFFLPRIVFYPRPESVAGRK